MNQKLGATVQPGGQQPGQQAQPAQTLQPGQPGQQAQAAVPSGVAGAGQTLPTAAPTTAGAPAAGVRPAGSPATPAISAGARPAGAPGNPAAPSTVGIPGNPAVRPAGQMGPGSGVPNPNYRYNAKPSLLGTGLQRDILSLLIKIAVIAGAVFALFTFIFGVFQYTSASMDPHVKSGDLIMYSRFDTNYAAQDLIVLSYQGEMQVRRVVAIAGDTVDFETGGLIVNGSRQQEAGIFTETERYESEVSFPLTVPAGHVFVLGDHRPGATDSRIYGPVDAEDTLGKVTSVFRRRGL